MIKIQTDDNEVVTKGFLRETINEAIDAFARTINKSFVHLEARMDGMAQQKDLLWLSGRTDDLARRVDQLDSRLGKFEQNVDGRFDKVFSELKDIRHEINNNSADIPHLEFRVKKLEKKAGLE